MSCKNDRLSESDKKQVREWLVGRDRCEEFIKELDSIYALMKSQPQQLFPERKELIKHKNETLKHLGKAIQNIELIIELLAPSGNCIGVNSYVSKVFLKKSHYVRSLQSLRKVKANLEERELFVNYGQQPESLFYKAVTFSIADRYMQLIERPTSYRDGPFYNIVISFFQFLGIKIKAPDRIIEPAVKFFASM